MKPLISDDEAAAARITLSLKLEEIPPVTLEARLIEKLGASELSAINVNLLSVDEDVNFLRFILCVLCVCHGNDPSLGSAARNRLKLLPCPSA